MQKVSQQRVVSNRNAAKSRSLIQLIHANHL